MIICSVIMSCKKNPTIEGENKPVAVAVEHGAVQESITEKTIGAAGGVLWIPGTEINVTIPSGALDVDTKFTIQSVKNTLKSGLGRSFRLLPENIRFKKDVLVSIAYLEDSIQTTDKNFLFLAYQDVKGFWRRPNGTILDSVNRTLTVPTRHFSDWTIEMGVKLINKGKKALKINETTQFEVMNDVLIPEKVPGQETDDLIAPTLSSSDVKSWVKYGPGNLLPNGVEAKYTAPALIPQNSRTTIGVIVDSLKNSKGKYIDVYLSLNVELLPDEYIFWEFRGIKYEGIKTRWSIYGNKNERIGLSAQDKDSGFIAVIIEGTQIGSYQTGLTLVRGKMFVDFSHYGYRRSTIRMDCTNPQIPLIANSGQATITLAGPTIGSYVEGYADVDVTLDNTCNPAPEKLKIYFRAKSTE